MTRFNLLPPEYLNKRKRRRMYLLLTLTQALITAAVLLSFPLIDRAELYLRARTRELAALIASPAYIESDVAAAELARLNETAAATDYMLSRLQPALMDGEWLKALNETLPENVELAGFKMEDGRMAVSCITADLLYAEHHRRLLEGGGLSAAIGAVTSNHGLYSYEILCHF